MSLFSRTIVVEDGTGLPNANSYLSVADAKQYLTNIGKSSLSFFSLTDDVLEKFLVAAGQYLDNEYQFLDNKKKENQGLEFPRGEQDSVPEKVKQAIVELALIISDGSIYSEVDENTTLITEQAVGPIVTKFAEATKFGLKKESKSRLEFVRDLLKDYIDNYNYDSPTEFVRS